MPCEVDKMAIPRPLITLGRASALAYVRRPGLLILVSLVMAEVLVPGLYLSSIVITPWILACSSILYCLMYPLSCRTLVIFFLMFEAGISTILCLAWMAFLILVR